MAGGRNAGRWGEAVRRTPVGVLLLAGLLGVLGAGFVVGAAYLALARPEPGWVPAVMGLGAGPLALYVALHLLRLTHWAWLAMVLSLLLLLASSAWRLLTAPQRPGVAIAEIVLEVLALLYLARRRVRTAFMRR
jgi:hypothetical protein